MRLFSPPRSLLVDLLLLWGSQLASSLWADPSPPAWWAAIPTLLFVFFVPPSQSPRRGLLLSASAAGGVAAWAGLPLAIFTGLAAWLVLSVAWRTLRAMPRSVTPAMAGGGPPPASAPSRWTEQSRRLGALAFHPRSGVIRWILLLLAAPLLMRPYLTHGIIGAVDAVWYHNVVADFLIQVRAGAFPAWAGQTGFAFHGGIFPLRVAPLLQHLAALVDLLTGRQLAPYTVLNLTLFACLLGGLLSCHLCLLRIMPRRAWTAAALAFLYASCPGVLGLVYAQDLYMSFATLPWLPVVFLGMVRSFERDDLHSRLLMGGGLAAAWLAHSPIAMWCGFMVVASQAGRVLTLGVNRRSLQADALGAVCFALLAGYTLVSVTSLGPVPLTRLEAGRHLAEIGKAFPGNWLPVPRAVPLENLQVGYGLSLVLIGTVFLLCICRDRLAAILAGGGLVLLALLAPIPVLTAFFWEHLPATILEITHIWPMQRLLVLVALAAVFAAALALRALDRREPTRIRPWMTLVVLAPAVLWSGAQARQFIAAADGHGRSVADSTRLQRPENLQEGKFMLRLSQPAPRFASAGVVDPEMEHHFLDPRTLELRGGPVEAVFPGYGPGTRAQSRPPLGSLLSGEPDANPGILKLSPALRLEPAQRYLLGLEFLEHDYHGVLIIEGREIYREYSLPSSGEPLSFGAEPGSSRVIPLWTSTQQAETVQLKFVPTAPGAKPTDFTPFARFELRPYDSRRLPLFLESVFPYRARVTAESDLRLEIPRIALTGYQAKVDGEPVTIVASPDGQVTVPVGPGTHAVTLEYIPPGSVRQAYWATLVAWLLWPLALAITSRRRPATDG
jgi:hypothetical protein